MSLSAETSKRLIALCAYLRTQGIEIGPSRVIAAAHLLEARGLSLEGAQARSNALRLGPVLCRNADEQHLFKQLVVRWAPDGPAQEPPDDRSVPVIPWSGTGPRTLSWLGPTSVLLALLFLGGFGCWLYFGPVAAPPAAVQTATTSAPLVSSAEGNTMEVSNIRMFARPPPSAPDQKQGSPWGPWAGLAFFLVLFVTGLLWLRHNAFLERRRAAKGRHAVRLSADLHVPLDAVTAAMRTLGLSFRQRQRGFEHRLDVRKSAEATARHAGLFTGVYGAPRERRFLALVRRQAMHDHQAFIGEGLVAQLCRSGADVLTFRFDADANVVEPYAAQAGNGRQSTPHGVRTYPRIDDVLSANEQAECLLFCEPAALLDPLTGRLASWCRTIVDGGHHCTVFTVAPPHRWDSAREVLETEHIRVVAADAASINALARNQRIAAPVRRRALGDGALHEQYGLYQAAPPGAEVAAICDAICGELGYTGFQWVQACAIYPEIQWPLTNAVGALLVKDAEERARLLLRLADLVWFRKAYMPDWLRAALIARLDRKTGTELRAFFWNAFALELDELGKGNASIDVMRPSPLQAILRWLRVGLALSALAQGESYKEQLFARYLLGQKNPLSLRIPHRVMAAMHNALRGPVVVLASFCVTGAGLSMMYGAVASDTRTHVPTDVDAKVGFRGDSLVIAGIDRDTGAVIAARRDALTSQGQWEHVMSESIGTPKEVALSADGAYLIALEADGMRFVPTSNASVPLPNSNIAGATGKRQWLSVAPGRNGTVQRYLSLFLLGDGNMRADVADLAAVRQLGRVSYLLRNMPAPEAVALGRVDEMMLLMHQDRTVVLRPGEGGSVTVLQPENAPIKGRRRKIAWGRNGDLPIFAACSSAGTVVVWDVAQSRAILSHQADEAFVCNALAVSAGGRYIAVGSSDGRAILLDVGNPSLTVKLTDKGPPISDISFNEGHTQVALVTTDLATVVADLTPRKLRAGERH